MNEKTDWITTSQACELSGYHPDSMRKLLPTLGYKDVSIASMRDVNMKLSGSERIEDSYYFATAEVGRGNGLILTKENGGVP